MKPVLKYLSVILMLLFVTACGGSVSGESMDNAHVLCKPNGGIRYIYLDIEKTLYCKNGATFVSPQWLIGGIGSEQTRGASPAYDYSK